MNNKKIVNIAVIVAGIDEEYQCNIINGINEFTRKMNINTSYFAAFGGVLASRRYDIGEYSIYNLINLSKFDGVILMTNTISSPPEKNAIIEKVKSSGIPAVVFDSDEFPEFYNISIDNYTAMSDMVRHVINRHDARIINYISGPLTNPEALARYNAFLSVMGEYGLSVDNKRVFFGEFRGKDGKQAVCELINSGLEMPDAIICANDAMALAAVTELEKHGYTVPGDIIVTGFDYTYNARNFSPALTSVNRPLFDAGYKACEIIVDILNGKTPEKNTVLEATSAFSESCGCLLENSDDYSSYKKRTYRLIDTCTSHISMLNRMTACLAETETTSENIEVISRFLSELECEKCCLCLCSEWHGAFRETFSSSNSKGNFTKNMSAPLIWENGKCHEVVSFSSENMFPEPLSGSGNISYFLPIHFRERCLGYYVIINGDFPIKSLLCHTLIMNISNSIENIRKLLHLNNAINELNKLYVIDPLCNIYNRNGFIKIADDMFRDAVAKQQKVMVSFIDMDGLKFINDNYGHNEGDFAIQRLADIINECCTINSICARFGGDEFVVFGVNMNETDAEALESKFRSKIDIINSIIKKPYKLSASFGSFVTVPTADNTLYGIIKAADEKMYNEKKYKKNARNNAT